MKYETIFKEIKIFGYIITIQVITKSAQEALNEFAKLVDDEDFVEAHKIEKVLEKRLGQNNSDLIRISTLLHFLEE